MMNRGYNFGAGPSMLPDTILYEAQQELMNWQHQGVSILEVGHRTSQFMALMNDAEQDLRLLLNIPQHYQVLFLGNAARTQFSMIPMNLLADDEQAGYLVTGLWSEMAFNEAKKVKAAYCVADGRLSNYTQLPQVAEWQIQPDTAYFYYTPNETVNGIRMASVPQTNNIPLVADMTSCLLTEPLDVNQYGLIFAGAQKNISIAGLTIVIVDERLLSEQATSVLPTMMDYKIHHEYRSLYATPPTFACYLAGKMFRWLLDNGGVNAFYKRNQEKAAALYHYIDSSDFYHCAVDSNARSLVNACFTLQKPDLENQFVSDAEACGLLALRGHRTVGGLRASFYNAMPMEGIVALLTFMQDFARKHS